VSYQLPLDPLPEEDPPPEDEWLELELLELLDGVTLGRTRV
jgi:hypothetical protein